MALDPIIVCKRAGVIRIERMVGEGLSKIEQTGNALPRRNLPDQRGAECRFANGGGPLNDQYMAPRHL